MSYELSFTSVCFGPLIVLFVRQHMADEQHLPIEVDSGDHAKIVAAHIEHVVLRRNVVDRVEGFPQAGQIIRLAFDGQSIPRKERTRRGRMSVNEFRKHFS
ncbi:hypothetical protein CBA19CS22_20055 [Caballeronia novacaledonica]|uniref:Uncharacterized protein n=1 Tax=Caballeronia novacaledonica TaxID=1544861 RepID=A0ACB5QUN4_9BURK|nr:hypothetical protein CBA19CS22_20055 [Caballeronia novacaledonica]